MSLFTQKFYHLLYDWYDINHRILPWRETENPYYIWLSEIILQQTRVAQGMEYYHRFVSTFPTIEQLAQADEDSVLRLWQGLGYYSRARNLHKAARQIVANHVSASVEPSTPCAFPSTFSDLRALPGVGDYTAGAITSFAYNRPYPALDGNVYRVLARLFDCDMPFDTSAGKKHFHELAEQVLDREHPRQFNSAIMEFGALHCLPTSPDCEACPIQDFCRAHAAGTAELLPVRKPRPTLRNRYFTYYIYIALDNSNKHAHGFLTLIHQRTAKDIWQHLYEFPLVEHVSAPRTDREWTENTPITDREWTENAPITDREWSGHDAKTGTDFGGSSSHNKGQLLAELTHILSHQRIHARFYVCPVDVLPVIPDTIAIAWDELDHYALSRLTLKAISSQPLAHLNDLTI